MKHFESLAWHSSHSRYNIKINKSQKYCAKSQTIIQSAKCQPLYSQQKMIQSMIDMEITDKNMSIKPKVGTFRDDRQKTQLKKI